MHTIYFFSLFSYLYLSSTRNPSLCCLIQLQCRDHIFFHALVFARSRGSCLNTRPQGRVFKRLPKDPTNVNAMKQTCDRYSCILPDSSLKLHRKRRKVIKIIVFCKLNLIVQNGVGLQNRTSKTSFPLTTSMSTKPRQNAHSGPQRCVA